MAGHVLGDDLGDKLGEHFVTRHARLDGTLFRGPDPGHRGKVLSLLITFEAWDDYEQELPAAIDRAIGLLERKGGYAVICENRAHELKVVRGSELDALSQGSR